MIQDKTSQQLTSPITRGTKFNLYNLQGNRKNQLGHKTTKQTLTH